MKKHRLAVEDLQVQSLIAGPDAAGALFDRPTTFTGTHTVLTTDPIFTDICIPSEQTCNCVTHPWC